MLLAHSIDPKLHRLLSEQVPRVGRLNRLREMQNQGIELARRYYSERKSELRVKDTDMAAFVVGHVCEALTHVVVNYHPEYLEDGRAANEITDLLVRYLLK
jgi:hypothetical protein